ncbi:hypothetical protein HNR21_004571 [Actinomadura cellulosilytica]|uniref:Uncharacterized protein n=1 Tax=Thermomonospora cellulosilytica TaxID=1411118 RepID=A0A7W3N1D6_9ACTN|nr:hypothetical protein [Thermomonospora cellulosilytica]
MGAMNETPDSAAATYEDLLRQTRRIYRELERYGARRESERKPPLVEFSEVR